MALIGWLRRLVLRWRLRRARKREAWELAQLKPVGRDTQNAIRAGKYDRHH